MRTAAALIIAAVFASPTLADGELIVFTQPNASPLAESFEADYLDGLRELASKMKLSLRVIDASTGAPEAVAITPLIVFQNHRGRSVYQGRYTTLPRVKNFVRTARRMPRADDVLALPNLPVKAFGRARVGTPIKITPLAGELPEGFSQDAFAAGALLAVQKGLAAGGFTVQDKAQIRRTDRLFYVDFYPYRGADGKLFISLALFSQFHCHEPVYTSGKVPVEGAFAQYTEAFETAAKRLATQVEAELKNTRFGDGIDALSQDVPVKTWEQLGLTLPDPPANASREPVGDVTLATDWTVDAKAGDSEPMVQFAFAAPLDGYAGEVSDVAGTMKLGKDGALADASGQFTVKTASLTMGEEDLDVHIHDSLLKVAKHPTATFRFDKVQSPLAKIAFGQVTPTTLVGKFTLMGKAIDLTAPASIEPYLDDDGNVRLLVEATWQLGIKDVWGLEGPPGPKSARNTMQFRAAFVLRGDERE